MKLEDMTKGYLLALYSNIESLFAKDSSWGVLDKKVNREFNTDAKKAVFGFMQMIPPTTEKGAAMINYIALEMLKLKEQGNETAENFWKIVKPCYVVVVSDAARDVIDGTVKCFDKTSLTIKLLNVFGKQNPAFLRLTFYKEEHIEAIHVAKKLVAKLNNSTLCAYELNGVKRWNASEVLSLAQ